MIRTILVFLLAATANTFAQQIAGWDVDGIDLDDGSYSNNFELAAHTTALHVASARLTLSPEVNRSTSASQYGFKISSGETNLTGALAADHFMQLEVVADEDYVLDLAELHIRGQTTSTGCDDVAVLSSVAGFNTNGVIDSVHGIKGVTGGFDTDSSGFGGPISLTNAIYSGLNAVTFRIYGWQSSSGAGVTHVRDLAANDGFDLLLTGTVRFIPDAPTVLIIR